MRSVRLSRWVLVNANKIILWTHIMKYIHIRLPPRLTNIINLIMSLSEVALNLDVLATTD